MKKHEEQQQQRDSGALSVPSGHVSRRETLAEATLGRHGRELADAILQSQAPDVKSYSVSSLMYPTEAGYVIIDAETMRNHIRIHNYRQQQQQQPQPPQEDEADNEGNAVSDRLLETERSRVQRTARGSESPRRSYLSWKIEDCSPIMDTDGLMGLCELMEQLLMTLPKPKQLCKQQAKTWSNAFRKRAQARLNQTTCDPKEANTIAAALVLFEACKKPVASDVMNLGVYLVHFETILTHAFDALGVSGTTDPEDRVRLFEPTQHY